MKVLNQMQLKEEIEIDFPMPLKTVLRQDPDIIMLCEERDEATAEMAVRSSLTGHMLLSTLHTNSEEHEQRLGMRHVWQEPGFSVYLSFQKHNLT